MTLRIPEECGDCTKPTCVCRECEGNQAPYCLDFDGNPCVFDGNLSCTWYQHHMVRKEAFDAVG